MTLNLYSEGNVNKNAEAVASTGGYRLLGVPVGGAATLTAASTTLLTPASGNFIRLRWLSLSSLSTGTECLVTVLLGGQTIYLWGLPTPGAFSRRSTREGAIDAALVVQLTPAGGPVYINYETEELTP